MGTPNWKNRTLFHGDNLAFLRAMNSESVDLIATDPPFNKGRGYMANSGVENPIMKEIRAKRQNNPQLFE